MANSQIVRIASRLAGLPPTSRGISSPSNNVFGGIDLVIQPNGFQLTSYRHPWTNDTQFTPPVTVRKCITRRCAASLPGYLRTSAVQQYVQEKNVPPAIPKQAEPVILLVPPEEDIKKAAAAARKKARFGYLQSIRSNLAKI